MLETTKDMIRAAIDYKRRVAGTFMLVEPKNMRARLSGSDFAVTRKIDGVMAYCVYRDGDVAILGSAGRDLSAVPVARDLAAALKAAKAKDAVIAAELYVPNDNGRPRVFDANSALADPNGADKLRLAPFDVVRLDGEDFRRAHYKETHAKLVSLFRDESVRPVEMRTAASEGEVEAIYEEWVNGEGAEGLVVHSEMPIVWKVKPRHTVDAAIVGFTTGELGVRDLMFAVRHEDGTFQTFGASGNGLDEGLKASLAKSLADDAVPSDFVQTDSRGIAFQMVRPGPVAEVSFGELIAENSEGKIRWNPLLEFDGAKWLPKGRTPGVSAISLVVERLRDDKTCDAENVRLSQLSDICPFAARRAAAELPKSTLLRRKVFKKVAKDKVMLQKFVTWKTNKEADPRYPAYVFHYTDYSSGRKDPLKKDLRVAATEAEITSIFDAFITENVKKGWNEISS